LGRLAAHAPLVLWSATNLFLVLWLLMSALKTNQQIFANPWGLPDDGLHWENFQRAWVIGKFGYFIFNSVYITVVSVALTVLVSSMAAYVLGRFTFRLNRPIYYYLIAGLMVPYQLLLVPLVLELTALGLYDTPIGLILVYITMPIPFTVFFLTTFFGSLPTELEEAAALDGCSEFGIFWRIMFPLAKPGLVTMLVYNALWTFNEYILSLVLIASPQYRTLPLGIAYLNSAMQFTADWSLLFAGLIMMISFTLGFYAIMSNRIQSGLTVGAIKG
jgi:ABC-type glycerol-3-phosphate transport system permease component